MKELTDRLIAQNESNNRILEQIHSAQAAEQQRGRDQQVANAMHDIYRDARERERDRRIVGLGLPCCCWALCSRFGCCRGKSPANGLHITWIITDLILTMVLLLMSLFGR